MLQNLTRSFQVVDNFIIIIIIIIIMKNTKIALKVKGSRSNIARIHLNLITARVHFNAYSEQVTSMSDK